MYGKYSTRGEVNRSIQYKVKLSAAFDIRPHPEYFIISIARLNGALNDLVFCVGRIGSSNRNGSGT